MARICASVAAAVIEQPVHLLYVSAGAGSRDHDASAHVDCGGAGEPGGGDRRLCLHRQRGCVLKRRDGAGGRAGCRGFAFPGGARESGGVQCVHAAAGAGARHKCGFALAFAGRRAGAEQRASGAGRRRSGVPDQRIVRGRGTAAPGQLHDGGARAAAVLEPPVLQRHSG